MSNLALVWSIGEQCANTIRYESDKRTYESDRNKWESESREHRYAVSERLGRINERARGTDRNIGISKVDIVGIGITGALLLRFTTNKNIQKLENNVNTSADINNKQLQDSINQLRSDQERYQHKTLKTTYRV